MGAWIEIPVFTSACPMRTVAPHDGCVDWNAEPDESIVSKKPGRTPRWVRGLKFLRVNLWLNFYSRTPRWVRGLKLNEGTYDEVIVSRTPRWVRGLKYHFSLLSNRIDSVAPHDGCVDWNWFTVHVWWVLQRSRTPRWVRGLKFLQM